MWHDSQMELWALSDLCTPWCIHVVATLRVADHLAAGRNDIDTLAAAAGADPESLQRVLRHLVSVGLFAEETPGHFALNPAAQSFQEDGVRFGLNLDGFGGRMAFAWGTLLSAVRSGKPAYHEAFGRGFWEDLEANPAIAEEFDALMGPGHGVPSWHILLDPEDWKSVRTVVDVGGGTGSLLAEILKAQPQTTGILVDLPRTVARSSDVFHNAGVEGRATAIGQSFFEPLPSGSDLYLMKNVLSDWPDAEASQILQRCADAARPNGRVAILGGVSQESVASPELLMMVLVGGKSRTLEEFRALAWKSGLEVRAAGLNPSGRYSVECVPL